MNSVTDDGVLHGVTGQFEISWPAALKVHWPRFTIQQPIVINFAATTSTRAEEGISLTAFHPGPHLCSIWEPTLKGGVLKPPPEFEQPLELVLLNE